MGLLVKPAPTGAIKRPVHRLLLPRMILPAFFSLSFFLPPLSSFYSARCVGLRGKNEAGKAYGEGRGQAATVLSKVFLKIRGTPRSVMERTREREREATVREEGKR